MNHELFSDKAQIGKALARIHADYDKVIIDLLEILRRPRKLQSGNVNREKKSTAYKKRRHLTNPVQNLPSQRDGSITTGDLHTFLAIRSAIRGRFINHAAKASDYPLELHAHPVMVWNFPPPLTLRFSFLSQNDMQNPPKMCAHCHTIHDCT